MFIHFQVKNLYEMFLQLFYKKKSNNLNIYRTSLCVSICMYVCVFVPLCLSAILSLFEEDQLLLEPSQQGHSGIGQKPDPKPNLESLNLKTPKIWSSWQNLGLCDMFGVMKHVLQLGNSMVSSDKSFESNYNQTLKPVKP